MTDKRSFMLPRSSPTPPPTEPNILTAKVVYQEQTFSFATLPHDILQLTSSMASSNIDALPYYDKQVEIPGTSISVEAK